MNRFLPHRPLYCLLILSALVTFSSGCTYMKAGRIAKEGERELVQGNFDSAIKMLETAKGIAPDAPYARGLLGEAYLRSHRPDDAWVEFCAAIYQPTEHTKIYRTSIWTGDAHESYIQHNVMFNKHEKRAFAGFSTLWNAYKRSGTIRLGARKADITASLGQPNRIIKMDNAYHRGRPDEVYALAYIYGVNTIFFLDDQAVQIRELVYESGSLSYKWLK
ncbi:MAG TPA: tetratricopeptide repeat protein [Kiritimatiellia bacterium]|nr:tetratricopeptide repeat protein [Kiritimatiellia bacterium]